jgi:hypothetical protein
MLLSDLVLVVDAEPAFLYLLSRIERYIRSQVDYTKK